MRPAFTTGGQPPCGTPNRPCIPIDGTEILLTFALIYGIITLWKKRLNTTNG